MNYQKLPHIKTFIAILCIFPLIFFCDNFSYHTKQARGIANAIDMKLKIKKFLDINARKTYYNGYILPLIDYCCIIWGECKNEGITIILKLQKRAARLILDADPLSPSTWVDDS